MSSALGNVGNDFDWMKKGLTAATNLATPYHAKKGKLSSKEEIKQLRSSNAESLQLIENLQAEKDAIQRSFNQMKDALAADGDSAQTGEDGAELQKKSLQNAKNLSKMSKIYWLQ